MNSNAAVANHGWSGEADRAVTGWASAIECERYRRRDEEETRHGRRMHDTATEWCTMPTDQRAQLIRTRKSKTECYRRDEQRKQH